MPTNPTANSAIALYNFYRRYLWTDTDFSKWQTGMVQYAQGIMDGLFHGACLQGLGYLANTGLNVQVDGGIAVGPTGQLLVLPATGSYGATANFASPVANPARSLVVIRPNITQSNYITRPTNPFDSVPLQQIQGANVVVIDGTPAAQPAYPATQPGDVVLFGVRLAAGAATFASTDLDFEVRDLMGKNSLFQKLQSKFDDRVRPYRNGNQSVGIKPSQTSQPFQSTYVNGVLSIFPKTGSTYNGAAGDTFLNFQTGVISGADTASPAFTPTIPTAGNFIVATITLTSASVLGVAYGTQGTYAQCVAGIQSQKTAGAGCVASVSGAMLLAFVIVSSVSGTTVNDLDVWDARTTIAFTPAATAIGWGASGVQAVSAGTTSVPSNAPGIIYEVDTSGGAVTLNLPNPASNPSLVFTVVDKKGTFGTNACTLHRFGSEKIINLNSDYVMSSPYGAWNFYTNGTDWGKS